MSRYSDLVLADSPALYWRLGEPSGTNANDETANGNDGTYVDTPTLAVAGALTGDVDTAVTFNGSSERVTSSYAPFAAGSTRTFEVWAKGGATAGAVLGGAGSTTAPEIYLINIADVRWYVNSTSSVAWVGSWPNTTAWHHIAVVVNATVDAQLFINGGSRGVLARTNDYATPGNFCVAAWGSGPGDWFAGSVDEVAVYESALTAAQIAEHYRVGREERVGNPMRGGF